MRRRRAAAGTRWHDDDGRPVAGPLAGSGSGSGARYLMPVMYGARVCHAVACLSWGEIRHPIGGHKVMNTTTRRRARYMPPADTMADRRRAVRARARIRARIDTMDARAAMADYYTTGGIA
jgi:hypothetical protein